MQPQFQRPPQAMPQTQHYIPVQAPSQRGSSTDASACGRHKHGKHRPKPQKSPRRAEYSDPSSVHSAQSDYFSDSGKSESSVTTVSSATTVPTHTPHDYRHPYDDRQFIQEPCPSVSDNCSDSGQSESSVNTVIGPGIPPHAAPNHGYPEYSGYPRRSHRKRSTRASSVAPSSVASFSVAATTEYGGDDERSESNFSMRSRPARPRGHRADDERSESASTLCGPDLTCRSPEFGADLNEFYDEVVFLYEEMENALVELQNFVGVMKDNYTTTRSSYIPGQPSLDHIKIKIDFLKQCYTAIESSFPGHKPPKKEYPLFTQQRDWEISRK